MPSPSTRFGRYFLLEKIAVGGMGEVWLARAEGDSADQPPVVVKRLLPHLKEDQDFVNMFFDEARIAASLDHPNIARIEDLGEVAGDYYIAMEHVHGLSFGDVVNAALEAGTDMPVALKCRVVAEAAAALDFAHAATTENGAPLELIHRDVSPQNIMVAYDGSVKLIDFGVARAANKLTRTATGVIKGKYAYMSPEQAWGKDLDGRSDLFGLGIVLWEVLALERLFKRENDTATLRAVVGAELEPPSHKEPTVPRALDAIVLKALTRAPEGRFQTGLEFKKALEAFLTKQRLPATRAHLAGWMQKLFPEESRKVLPAHPEPSQKEERSSPVLKPALEDPKLPRSKVLDVTELERAVRRCHEAGRAPGRREGQARGHRAQGLRRPALVPHHRVPAHVVESGRARPAARAQRRPGLRAAGRCADGRAGALTVRARARGPERSVPRGHHEAAHRHPEPHDGPRAAAGVVGQTR